MCTVVVLRRPEHDWPLILGANRDEMIERAWRPPGRHWPDRPDIIAGLDELAGGSWLGLNDNGVVAAILNRFGTLGPAPGRRSRGELVLEALDHADAADAAAALSALAPEAYRPFNMIIADNRDAFWLRHADPTGTLGIAALPLPPGLSMIAAGDLNDLSTPRLRLNLPRFEAAAVPQPGRGDWETWEALLTDDTVDAEAGPTAAMRFRTAAGFATVSSALIALPAPLPPRSRSAIRPVFRFATHQPAAEPWQDLAL